MNRRSALRYLGIMGAGSFVGCVVARGSVQHQDAGTDTFRSEVRLVLLDVSVKDRDGGFVPGLSKDNFEVLENGRPQRITVFDHDDRPVTVGILVDESRSMTSKRVDVLTAAQTFIAESNPRDQIFVLNFNDRVTPGLSGNTLFSDDAQELRSALYRGVPEGKTALHDAVVMGLQQLELGQRDKKTLVVISDGGDNVSKHTRRQMLDTVERSIATIYTIGLFDLDDPDRNPGILQQLAKISGGDAYFPASASDMVPVCRNIAKEIRTRYTIGYRPQLGASSLRHLRVHVLVPGRHKLSVHARSSNRYDEIEHHRPK